jgi:hypothetical protein
LSGSTLDLRSAKSFVGQRVNVTLADCAVIVNVQVKAIRFGWLIFVNPKVPKVKLDTVTLLQPVRLPWNRAVCRSQKVTVGPVKFIAWRRRHRCGACSCDRNRFGSRLLGVRKCARCPALQEASA